MRTTALRRTLTILATALCALVLPLSATAAADSAADRPDYDDAKATFTLTIVPLYTMGDFTPEPRRAELTCSPDGGTHPSPREACAVLDRVDGDIAKLPGETGPCPTVIIPVLAVAVGNWEGNGVHYIEQFNNRCLAGLATHGVFSF